MPLAHGDDGHQDRADDHHTRHRDTVSSGQRVGGFEDQHDQHHADAEHRVDAWHIDLAQLRRGCVRDLHARKLAELHRLPRDREHAGDHRLRRDDGRECCQRDQWVVRPMRRNGIEHKRCGFGIDQQLSALPKVVEQQCWQTDRQPCDTDRIASEMAHIGVKRFAACHRQHHGAQRDERDPRLTDEQVDAVHGIGRFEDLRCLQNCGRAEHGDRDEPEHHHRPENLADPCQCRAIAGRTARPE